MIYVADFKESLMTNDTRRALIGFLTLDDAERADFVEQVMALIEMTPQAQREYLAQLKSQRHSIKMNLGPLADPCPCCGK